MEEEVSTTRIRKVAPFAELAKPLFGEAVPPVPRLRLFLVLT